MFCKYCGTQLPDGSAFCGNCGKALQQASYPQQPTPYPQQPSYPQNTPYPQQARMPMPPTYVPQRNPAPAPKKNGNKGLIAAIVALIVVLLLLIAAVVYFMTGEKDSKGGETTKTTQESSTEESTEEKTEATTLPNEPASETQEVTETTAVPTETAPPETTEPTETVRETSEFGEYHHSGDYILPDSNKRMLTEADIVGMSERDLQMAVNEIFARHGRKFTTPEIRYYFESKSWYQGTVEPADFSDVVFNEFEKVNMDFLLAAADERS